MELPLPATAGPRPATRRGPCTVRVEGKCCDLTGTAVKQWHRGKTAPCERLDCCDAYACKKRAGVEVEGQSKDQKRKTRERKAKRSGGGSDGSGCIVLYEAKQIVGDRLFNPEPLSFEDARRGEPLLPAGFDVAWLVRGGFKRSEADPGFFDMRWVTQAELVAGKHNIRDVGDEYKDVMVDNFLSEWKRHHQVEPDGARADAEMEAEAPSEAAAQAEAAGEEAVEAVEAVEAAQVAAEVDYDGASLRADASERDDLVEQLRQRLQAKTVSLVDIVLAHGVASDPNPKPVADFDPDS